jgi:hypothetical protein
MDRAGGRGEERKEVERRSQTWVYQSRCMVTKAWGHVLGSETVCMAHGDSSLEFIQYPPVCQAAVSMWGP